MILAPARVPCHTGRGPAAQGLSLFQSRVSDHMALSAVGEALSGTPGVTPEGHHSRASAASGASAPTALRHLTRRPPRSHWPLWRGPHSLLSQCGPRLRTALPFPQVRSVQKSFALHPGNPQQGVLVPRHTHVGPGNQSFFFLSFCLFFTTWTILVWDHRKKGSKASPLLCPVAALHLPPCARGQGRAGRELAGGGRASRTPGGGAGPGLHPDRGPVRSLGRCAASCGRRLRARSARDRGAAQLRAPRSRKARGHSPGGRVPRTSAGPHAGHAQATRRAVSRPQTPSGTHEPLTLPTLHSLLLCFFFCLPAFPALLSWAPPALPKFASPPSFVVVVVVLFCFCF